MINYDLLTCNEWQNHKWVSEHPHISTIILLIDMLNQNQERWGYQSYNWQHLHDPPRYSQMFINYFSKSADLPQSFVERVKCDHTAFMTEFTLNSLQIQILKTFLLN
jgi:hypothetical protein